MNFLENVKAMFDVMSSSPYFLGLIIVFVLLAVLLITTNKDNAKRTKIIYSVIYVSCIGALLFIYHASIMDMLNHLMDHLFIFFYFPNFAAYFFGIIITNVILWKTVFNNKTEKTLKITNSIVYCLLHYIFILLLNVITTNDLDVFREVSIYQNIEALSLVRLSSTIFVMWIIFITIYSLIRKYQTRGQLSINEQVIETIKYVSKPSLYNEIEIPNVIRSEMNIKPKKQGKIELVLPPLCIYSDHKVGYKTEPTIIEQMITDIPYTPPTSIITNIETTKQPIIKNIETTKPVVEEIEPIIKNIQTVKQEIVEEVSEAIIKNINTNIAIEKKQQERTLEIFDSMFTLEDYKVLLDLLKRGTIQPETQKDIVIPIKKSTNENVTDLEAFYR